MENELLADRRKALEEEFFRKENERQRAALQARKKRDESKAALRETGIGDDALIDRLLDLGVDAEAVVALELAPLVAVAWADGTLDDRERDAVLRAARHAGVTDDQPASSLLQGWLRQPPAPHLLETWAAYVRDLCAQMTPEARRTFREQLLGRTRAVAEAAGGFLGVGRVSAKEQAVLAELERAFAQR
jgi:hypothetical protein